MNRSMVVGILFFIGVLILGVVTIMLTDWTLEGFNFQVRFSDVAGLDTEKPVFYHGYKVGKVKGLDLQRDGSILVTIRILEDIVIPRDVIFTVDDSTFFGGKQVTIEDPVGPPSSTLLNEIVDLRITPPRDPTPLHLVKDQIPIFVDIPDHLRDLPVSGSGREMPLSEALKEMLWGEDVGLAFVIGDEGIYIREALDGTQVYENVKRGRGVIQSVSNLAQDLSEVVKEIEPDVVLAMRKLREVLSKIEGGEGTLGKLVTEPDLHDVLLESLTNLRGITGRFNEPEFLDEVEEAIQNLGDILEQIKDADVGQVVKNLGDMAESGANILEEVEHGDGTVHRLIYDNALVEDIEAITGKLARGEGTLGRLLMEEDIYVKVDEALDQMNTLLAEVRGMVDTAKSPDSSVGKLIESDELYESALSAMDNISETLGVAARTWLAVGFGYRHTFDQELGIGKIYIRLIPRESRYFMVGASWLNPTGDVGDPLIYDELDQDEGKGLFAFDVQIAQLFFMGRDDLNDWNDVVLALRVGLLEGKVGGGMDVDFLQAFRFTVEARDTHRDPGFLDEQIDRFMLRSELSVRLWSYLRLYAGADNLAEDAGFLAGAQIEWFDQDIKGLISLLAAAF